MALLFMCSCGDDGNCDDLYGKWDSDSFHPTPSTSYGRLGGYGVELGDQPDRQMLKSLTMSGDTIIIGFAVKMIDFEGNDRTFLIGYDSGVVQWNFRTNVDGSIEFDDGSGSGEAAKSAAGAIPYNIWCYFEAKIKHSATVGTVDVRINGVSVISATSVDTIATANTYINRIKIGERGTSGTGKFDVDDLYILDGTGTDNNDFLGDCVVEALLPNGNGNSSGMTGSDGNSTDNYQLVDELTPSFSDYVEASTEGTKDTYAMDDMSAGTSDSVYGIQTAVMEQKDDSGTKYMRTVIRSGTTDYVSSSRSLNTGWATALDIWEQDPNTSAAWTVTNVNAVEVGQEVRDS